MKADYLPQNNRDASERTVKSKIQNFSKNLVVMQFRSVHSILSTIILQKES